MKFRPEPSEQSGSNQVTVSVPPVHQKVKNKYKFKFSSFLSKI